MDWNPEQYLKFADHRLRPALDLLNRVDATAPGLVYDLGCGAGNVTRLLRARWPKARIVGIDSSPEMLERAKETVPDVEWVLRDVGGWSTDEPGDVVYSNAALHWLDGHETLFPRLLGTVRPGGTLAVQMPRNYAAATHTGMFATARSGPWAVKLAGTLRETPVRPPDFYWGLLSGPDVALDVWETEYLQVLQGAAPVVQWMMGTALKPLLEPLAAPERDAFVAEYTRRMAQAYPPRPDGATLLPFRRLFLVAKRRSGASGAAR